MVDGLEAELVDTQCHDFGISQARKAWNVAQRHDMTVPLAHRSLIIDVAKDRAEEPEFLVFIVSPFEVEML